MIYFFKVYKNSLRATLISILGCFMIPIGAIFVILAFTEVLGDIPVMLGLIILGGLCIWGGYRLTKWAKKIFDKKALESKKPKTDKSNDGNDLPRDLVVLCSCGAQCRLPKNIGRIKMTYPKCGTERFIDT